MKTSPMDAFPLKEYGHNLTHVARQGQIPPVGGYEAPVACIFQILLRRGKDNNKYNPLLLDLDEGRRMNYFVYYNYQRPHQALGCQIPTAIHFKKTFAQKQNE